MSFKSRSVFSFGGCVNERLYLKRAFQTSRRVRQQGNALIALTIHPAGFLHIEVALQAQPQVRRRAERTGQTQGGVRRDAAPTFDDVSDAAVRQGAGDGEPILADAERLQEIFQEHFTRMDVFQAFHAGLMVIDDLDALCVMVR